MTVAAMITGSPCSTSRNLASTRMPFAMAEDWATHRTPSPGNTPTGVRDRNHHLVSCLRLLALHSLLHPIAIYNWLRVAKQQL